MSHLTLTALTAFITISYSSVFASRCRLNAAVYNFKVGNLRGTVVSDGPIIIADNPYFVPELAVERSYATAFRSTNPILLAQNVVVLDVPNVGRVLVDSGSRGLQDQAFLRKGGQLFINLKAAGIKPTSIDFVLVTHGHFDHVGGLRAADGSPAFPNAIVYIAQREHEFWADPLRNPNTTQLPDESLSLFSSVYLQSIEPYRAGKFRLVPDNGRPLPGIRFILGPGHSPGHSAIEVTVEETRLIVSGDTWITRPDQLQNPEWGFSAESDSPSAYQSRINLLSLVAKRRDLVLAYHEQFPGLGFISQSGHLFDWVPAAPQRLSNGASLQC